MEDKSYRLAEYEIVQKGGGEFYWRTHGSFANTKSGKCFIEGNVLFLAPGEVEGPGCLKNEFLGYLKKLPPWDGTKYYCPNYLLYSCKESQKRRGRQSRGTRNASGGGTAPQNPAMAPADKKAPVSSPAAVCIRQGKGTLRGALHRCVSMLGSSHEKEEPMR